MALLRARSSWVRILMRRLVVVMVARALLIKVLRQLKRGISVQIDHVVNGSGSANNGADAGAFIVVCG